jgi:hypothetical protein
MDAKPVGHFKSMVTGNGSSQFCQWQGLALCQAGATFGFAAKIASIPLLATAVLPGGALGAGALVSMTGLKWHRWCPDWWAVDGQNERRS